MGREGAGDQGLRAQLITPRVTAAAHGCMLGASPFCVRPDLQPFYACTCLPAENRYGRPGFRGLLRQLANYWQNRRKAVIQAADRAAQALAQYASLQGEEGEIGPDLVRDAIQQMTREFDPVHGGFGGAPKFPPSMRLALMLREYQRSHDERLKTIVTTTLDR